jgi:uncharacterized membrane protein
MSNLVWAVTAFVGTHFLMSHPLRAPLVARLGENGFRGVYSLVSLVTFGWAVMAFRAAPVTEPLWVAGDGIWAIASLLMLEGAILFMGSLVGNPALPAPGAAALATKPVHGVFHITRHPMMWGFALWAIAHALVAPYGAQLVLTLGMLVLALGGSAGQDRKKAVLMGAAWKDWAARTSFVPYAAQLSGRAPWKTGWPGLRLVLLGTIVWLLVTYVHPMLGAPVAGIWRWVY